jgi:hypothetical protein
MTHRERHTPEQAPGRDGIWTPSTSTSASATAPAGVGAPPVAGSDQRDASPTDLWTDWYQRASPAQQQEALLRAIHQGIVYAHQLAAPPPSTAPLRSLLSNLLNGQVKELRPLHPPDLEYHDGELDRTQREAVARAVATPDVCLIQGSPGTGKSRLLAEIILQAAQRGERILLLAPTPAALDSVLERLSQHPIVCPIRWLGAEESLANLSPSIARLTLPERLRHYRETTLPAARVARDAALQALNVHVRGQVHWPDLETLAEQHEQLAQRLRILTERQDGVAMEVEHLDPNALFGERWRVHDRARTDALECIDSQLAGLQAELETIAAKQARLNIEWETIRPLSEARQGLRLWTGAWWRALLRSGLKEQVRDLEARCTELCSARQRLEEELAVRRNERLEIESRYGAEHRRLLDEEIARRRGELDNETASATREKDSVCERWRSVCAPLSGEAVPAEISRQAVAEGRAAWEHLRERDAQRAAAAEHWLQTVEEGARTLPEKLAGCANVFAAATTALPSDADIHMPPLFDLLLLDQAHQMTEPELSAAVRRARRWVLIGETPADREEVKPYPSRDRKGTGETISKPTPLPYGRGSDTRLARPSYFQRLWQNLHVDPCRLPFSWIRRDDRLVCRLRLFVGGHEKWIETEPVVDQPDIELRILSIPRQAPQIVEVLFPVGMDIGEAKQFIFHELEETAVQTCGRSLCWFETAEEVILEFAQSGADSETLTIALESGVSERIARLPTSGGMEWHTCSLGFARGAGWTRQRAEEWIAERLGLRSLGRTVLLMTPYRVDPPIALPSHTCPTCQKDQTTNHTNNMNKGKKNRENIRGYRH